MKALFGFLYAICALTGAYWVSLSYGDKGFYGVLIVAWFLAFVHEHGSLTDEVASLRYEVDKIRDKTGI